MWTVYMWFKDVFKVLCVLFQTFQRFLRLKKKASDNKCIKWIEIINESMNYVLKRMNRMENNACEHKGIMPNNSG